MLTRPTDSQFEFMQKSYALTLQSLKGELYSYQRSAQIDESNHENLLSAFDHVVRSVATAFNNLLAEYKQGKKSAKEMDSELHKKNDDLRFLLDCFQPILSMRKELPKKMSFEQEWLLRNLERGVIYFLQQYNAEQDNAKFLAYWHYANFLYDMRKGLNTGIYTMSREDFESIAREFKEQDSYRYTMRFEPHVIPVIDKKEEEKKHDKANVQGLCIMSDGHANKNGAFRELFEVALQKVPILTLFDPHAEQYLKLLQPYKEKCAKKNIKVPGLDEIRNKMQNLDTYAQGKNEYLALLYNVYLDEYEYNRSSKWGKTALPNATEVANEIARLVPSLYLAHGMRDTQINRIVASAADYLPGIEDRMIDEVMQILLKRKLGGPESQRPLTADELEQCVAKCKVLSHLGYKGNSMCLAIFRPKEFKIAKETRYSAEPKHFTVSERNIRNAFAKSDKLPELFERLKAACEKPQQEVGEYKKKM